MKNRVLILIMLLALFPLMLQAQQATDAFDTSFFNNSFNTPGNDLLVYPNPTADNARIVLPGLSTGISAVYVIDLNGNIIRTSRYPLGVNYLDIDMSRLPIGSYSVRVYEKGVGAYNLRVVKE